jgi:hypothetical protein
MDGQVTQQRFEQGAGAYCAWVLGALLAAALCWAPEAAAQQYNGIYCPCDGTSTCDYYNGQRCACDVECAFEVGQCLCDVTTGPEETCDPYEQDGKTWACACDQDCQLGPLHMGRIAARGQVIRQSDEDDAPLLSATTTDAEAQKWLQLVQYDLVGQRFELDDRNADMGESVSGGTLLRAYLLNPEIIDASICSDPDSDECQQQNSLHRRPTVMSAVAYMGFQQALSDASALGDAEALLVDALQCNDPAGALQLDDTKAVIARRNVDPSTPCSEVVLFQSPVSINQPPIEITGDAPYRSVLLDPQGQLAYKSRGVIAPETDFFSFHDEQDAARLETLPEACKPTTLLDSSGTERGPVVRQSDLDAIDGPPPSQGVLDAMRFVNCPPGFMSSEGELRAWSPIAGARVEVDAYNHWDTGLTDRNGYYAVEYTPIDGQVYPYNVYAQVAFETFNPRVPSSRYFYLFQRGGVSSYTLDYEVPTFSFGGGPLAAWADFFQQSVETLTQPAQVVEHSNIPVEAAMLNLDIRLTNTPIDGSLIANTGYEAYRKVVIQNGGLNDDGTPQEQLVVLPDGSVVPESEDVNNEGIAIPMDAGEVALVRLPDGTIVPEFADEEDVGEPVPVGAEIPLGDGASLTTATGDTVYSHVAQDRHVGLLTAIGEPELRDTDIHVFRMADGRLIGSRWGMSHREVRGRDIRGLITGDEDTGDQGGCQGKACLLASALMRGPASRFTEFARSDYNPAARVDPILDDSGKLTRPVRAGIELDYAESTFLRQGDQLQVVVINRATGYTGSLLATMQRGSNGMSVIVPIGGLNTDAITDVDLDSADWREKLAQAQVNTIAQTSVTLGPPNLKIHVRRQRSIDVGAGRAGDSSADYTIGFEGAALKDDEVIIIETEWLDRDGSALPSELPGMTGRFARVVPAAAATADDAPDDSVETLTVYRLEGGQRSGRGYPRQRYGDRLAARRRGRLARSRRHQRRPCTGGVSPGASGTGRRPERRGPVSDPTGQAHHRGAPSGG